jgi:hypothetical protein
MSMRYHIIEKGDGLPPESSWRFRESPKDEGIKECRAHARYVCVPHASLSAEINQLHRF